MSLTVLPLSFAALRVLCDAPRPDEVAEYEALRGQAWDADEVAIERWQAPGMKFLVVDGDGAPVVAGGWMPCGPSWFRGWMVGSLAAWAAHGKGITRIVRKLMDALLADEAVRLDVRCLADRTAACRWYMKGLKMRFEGAHPGMGARGETAATYARLRGK